MKIVIYGTGGVGGYFGGRLAQAGHDVVFLARGKHLEAIKEKGLEVKSVHGDFVVENAKATDDPSTVKSADLIVLGVKSWQVGESVKSLIHTVNEETIILPLQNGVSIVDEIIEMAGRDHVLGGTCKIISKVEAPGVINHMMFDPIIIAGELDNQMSTRLLKLQSVFEDASIKFHASSSIQTEIWKKFMFICSGGLGAVTRVSYGVLRDVDGTRDLLHRLIAEIYEVGRKSNIELPSDSKDLAMDVINKLPFEATSSLQRDIIEGRPSEIDYWNGTVVRLGEKLGVDVPVNSFIYDCLLPLEQLARENKK